MSTPLRILVAEDDAAIRMGVCDALTHQGYVPIEAGMGPDALDIALAGGIDLILLDLVLPKIDGLSILERVRKAQPTLPVIILTARGEEQDRIKGLRLGADDYVVKPFSVKELLARVEAVLRRSPARPRTITKLQLPQGLADLERQEVTFNDGQCQRLSERETQLLHYLAQHDGRAVSREELLAHVWGLPLNSGETRTVDVHIARLRQKLRDTGHEHRILRTIHGKGYALHL